MDPVVIQDVSTDALLLFSFAFASLYMDSCKILRYAHAIVPLVPVQSVTDIICMLYSHQELGQISNELQISPNEFL